MYEVRSGKIKLLYIAPERLGSNFFCNVLRALSIAQVIVDEAHCISEWAMTLDRPIASSVSG